MATTKALIKSLDAADPHTRDRAALCLGLLLQRYGGHPDHCLLETMTECSWPEVDESEALLATQALLALVATGRPPEGAWWGLEQAYKYGPVHERPQVRALLQRVLARALRDGDEPTALAAFQAISASGGRTAQRAAQMITRAHSMPLQEAGRRYLAVSS